MQPDGSRGEIVAYTRNTVIETEGGFEVVRLESTRDAPKPELDKARTRIESILRKRNLEARRRAFSDELWTRYHAQLTPVDASLASLQRLAQEAPETVLADQLDAARRLVASIPAELSREPAIGDPVLPESYERMRWFPLPGEAQRDVRAAQEAELAYENGIVGLVEPDPLVDAVEALEEPLVGFQPERREAVRGYPEARRVLRIGGERDHDRQRHTLRVVILERRDEGVPERAVSWRLDRLAPCQPFDPAGG